MLFTAHQKKGLALIAASLLIVFGGLYAWKLNTAPTVEVADSSAAWIETFDQPELPVPAVLRIDINLADSIDWVQLPGIGPVLAARIVRFREMKGGFHSVDDLRDVYNLPPTLLEELHDQLYLNPKTVPSGRVAFSKPDYRGPRLDLNEATAADLEQLPGIGAVLSQRIINYREARRGFDHVDDLKKVYQLSEETLAAIRPFVFVEAAPPSLSPATGQSASTANSAFGETRGGSEAGESFPRAAKPALGSVNLNEADSTTLESLPGIGPVLAQRILRYRRLIGFFAEVGQLRHVYGMTDELFGQSSPYFTVGQTDHFPKRDLNRAFVKSLAFFPFLDQQMAQEIVDYRRELGRFDRWEEVAQVPGMDDKTYKALQQYFHL